MARRKWRKRKIISDLAEQVCQQILLLPEGTEVSIGGIVDDLYQARGYAFIYLDTIHGWVWTKDDGKTIAIEARDLFQVMEIVEKNLADQIIFDHSGGKDRAVGLPYSIPFVIRIKR